MADSPQSIQKPQQQASAKTAVAVLADVIASRRDSLAAVATANFDADRLVKLAQAALSRMPKLAECTATSVLAALMRCSELGLEPNAALPQRRMWLVPRWNGMAKCLECSSQIDYRAEIQLARDTGLVFGVVAEDVREADEFFYEYSDEGDSLAKFRHRPVIFGERGAPIGYYAAARLEGGEVRFVAMSQREVEEHRDAYGPRNKAGELTGPWASGKAAEFRAMALKTLLHRLWNLLPAGKSEAARKLQEKLAEEAQQDAGRIDAGLSLPDASERPAALALKDRIKAAAQPNASAATAEDSTLEPGQDPAAMTREPGEEG